MDPADLDRPGLGEWDVRSLLGHTSRSFLTVQSYLDPDATAAPLLHGPIAYFRAALGAATDAAAITERGRQAGTALGADPVTAFDELAERVVTLVAGSPAATVCATPFGTISLIDYLPARAFELTVHGIDLARAVGAPVPDELVQCVLPAVSLCAEMADPQGRVTMLMALTGRDGLPSGFSVL